MLFPFNSVSSSTYSLVVPPNIRHKNCQNQTIKFDLKNFPSEFKIKFIL